LFPDTLPGRWFLAIHQVGWANLKKHYKIGLLTPGGSIFFVENIFG
jgi:hypothetical protein